MPLLTLANPKHPDVPFPCQGGRPIPRPFARAPARNGQLPRCWMLQRLMIQTLNLLHHHSQPPHADPLSESADLVQLVLNGSNLPKIVLTVLPRLPLQTSHSSTCNSQSTAPMTTQAKIPEPTSCNCSQTRCMIAPCLFPGQTQKQLRGHAQQQGSGAGGR